MDERIERFLLEVLEDEGKESNVVRANARCYLALYIEMFRAREVEGHRKDAAEQRCREWCRQRVLQEVEQREGAPTANHLRTVLNAIGEPSTDLNSTMLKPKRQPNPWAADVVDGNDVLANRSVKDAAAKVHPHENVPANNSASYRSAAFVKEPSASVANTTPIRKQRRSMLRDWFAPSSSRSLRSFSKH